MNRIIQYETDWTSYKVISKIWLDENDKAIASYRLEITNEDIELQELFVHPDNRRQGLSHEMLSDALKIITAQGKDTYLIVKKDYFIIKTYEQYGFKYHKDYDDEFNWMILTRKQWKN